MPYAIAAWLVHQRPERTIPTALVARQPCTGRTGGGRCGICDFYLPSRHANSMDDVTKVVIAVTAIGMVVLGVVLFGLTYTPYPP